MKRSTISLSELKDSLANIEEDLQSSESILDTLNDRMRELQFAINYCYSLIEYDYAKLESPEKERRIRKTEDEIQRLEKLQNERSTEKARQEKTYEKLLAKKETTEGTIKAFSIATNPSAFQNQQNQENQRPHPRNLGLRK